MDRPLLEEAIVSSVYAKATRILAQAGPLALLERSASYVYKRTVRPLLPVAAPVRYSGVPIGIDRKLGDRLLPSVARLYPDIPLYEETLVAGLKKYLQPGERVVVVGGGWGVTATIAALAVGPTGQVTCFEGDAEGCQRVRRTAERNGVSDRLSVIHAVVGEAIHVYGTVTAATTVMPALLPECDILQLDCEGAELAIIREMVIKPRVVLVETHGLFGAPTEQVTKCLEERGYIVAPLGVAERRSLSYCEANDIRVIVGIWPAEATN